MFCFMSAIVSYSASPLKRHSLVRPCTVNNCTPDSSAIFATSTPLRDSGDQPVRIFRVTGISTLLTTDFRIDSISFVSFNNAEPAAFFKTFLAGQPMLISIASAPRLTLSLAA